LGNVNIYDDEALKTHNTLKVLIKKVCNQCFGNVSTSAKRML